MSNAGLMQKNTLQSLVQFVRMRWAGWLFIAVLAIAAVWSARIALQSKPFDLRPAKGPSLKHEPDFEATRLSAWRSSADGTSRTHLMADKVVHYRDDLSSTYANPRFTIQTPLVQTVVSADFAQARNEGESLALTGSVQIRRTHVSAAQAPSSIETAGLTLYPDSGVATSRQPTIFKQATRTVQAKGGFDYRDTEAQIELLGGVSVTTPVSKK